MAQNTGKPVDKAFDCVTMILMLVGELEAFIDYQNADARADPEQLPHHRLS
jgi:hypothetical protein